MKRSGQARLVYTRLCDCPKTDMKTFFFLVVRTAAFGHGKPIQYQYFTIIPLLFYLLIYYWNTGGSSRILKESRLSYSDNTPSIQPASQPAIHPSIHPSLRTCVNTYVYYTLTHTCTIFLSSFFFFFN